MYIATKDIDCGNVEKLSDLQIGKVVDDNGGNKYGDSLKVSCRQTHYRAKDGIAKPANELFEMIKDHYKTYKDDSSFYKALCKCCQEKGKKIESLSRTAKLLRLTSTERERFHNCLKKFGFKKDA